MFNSPHRLDTLAAYVVVATLLIAALLLPAPSVHMKFAFDNYQ